MPTTTSAPNTVQFATATHVVGLLNELSLTLPESFEHKKVAAHLSRIYQMTPWELFVRELMQHDDHQLYQAA